MPPEPEPIVTYQLTFDLAADPEALRAGAAAVRGLGLRAHAADQTVDGAADQIDSEEAWLGQTAEAYQEHRRSLTGGLAQLGYASGRAADTLDQIADLLAYFQAALDHERANLAGIPTTESETSGSGSHTPAGTLVTFHPRTEEEATAVSDALVRAGDLRSALNELLVEKESTLRRQVDGSAPPPAGDGPGLADLAETWRPLSLRHVNLNIGGNRVGGDDTEEIAEIINRQGANVVTMQEVYEEDLGTVEEHLDGDWEIYYGHASNKRRGASPENWSESFGNAVLVRQGDGITSRSIEEDDRIGLDVPGSHVDPDEAETASVPAAEVPWEGERDDGEGRSAAVAEISISR